MSEQDSYKEMAVADFTIKMIAGVIFGTIAFVLGLVFLIIALVTNQPGELIGALIAVMVVGALVSIIDTIVLLKRKKSDKSQKE